MVEALAISKIIQNIPTEDRGILLREIGNDLRKNIQGYTGKLFLEIADKYESGL